MQLLAGRVVIQRPTSTGTQLDQANRLKAERIPFDGIGGGAVEQYGIHLAKPLRRLTQGTGR